MEYLLRLQLQVVRQIPMLLSLLLSEEASLHSEQAVASLGSTLAIKFLSRNFVEDADCGVYSHRFPLLHAPTTRNDSPNMLDAEGKDGDRRSNT
jgi:hypothetical protein